MLLPSVNFWQNEIDLKVFLFTHSIFLPAFLIIFLCWTGYNFFKARLKLAINKVLVLLILEQVTALILYFLVYITINIFLFYVSYYLWNYLFLEKILYLIKISLPIVFFVTIGAIFYNVNFTTHISNSKLLVKFLNNIFALFLFIFFDISVSSFGTSKNDYLFLASFFFMLTFILQELTAKKHQVENKQENEQNNNVNLVASDYYLLNYFSKFNGSFLVERGYEELLLN